MAISVGDALLKLGVDASGLNKGMKDAEAQVTQSLQKMQTQLRVVGTAFTAVGIAGLKMVSDARKLNAQLSSTAITIGTTTGEMRKMVLELANVDTGLGEVARTFELLARAGVRSREEMIANTVAFDALADATGSEADVVADILIPAFKVFGISLPKSAADMDKFTWLVKNTTVDLAEFGSVMQFVAMYGADLGITLDDMIGIMAALEARGITGSAATRLFRTAVNQAKEGTVSLNEVLGVTQEQIDGYNKQIRSATGLTQEYADAANKQYGIMDKLKFMWSKLSFTLGSVLTPMEPLFALMTAMGPIMIFLSTSVGRSTIAWIAHAAAVIRSNIASVAHVGSTTALATAQTVQTGTTVGLTFAQRALNAAMNAMPLIAIIAGIAALVALGIHLYRNWNTVSIKIDETWLWLKNTIAGGLPTYQAQMDALELELAWQELAKVVKDSYDKIVSDVEMATNRAISEAERVAGEERRILEQRATFYREKHYERLELIDEETLAELRAIDPALAAKVEASNKEIESLNAREKAREEAEEADRIATLEKERRDKETSGERKAVIDRELEAIEDAGKKEIAIEERNLLISQANADQYFENEATLVDTHLAYQIEAYNVELRAFQRLNTEKLENLETFVEEYKRIMGGAGMEPGVTLITPKGPAPETTRKRPSNPLEAAQWILSHFQAGGVIREPTLLYGLTSRRPYAIAGEAGTEYVGKAGNTFIYNVSFPGAIVREEQDLHKLSELVSRELKIMQDRTERRTGLRGG